MYITPIIPLENGTNIDVELVKKAEFVVIESAKLTGGS